MFSSFGRAFYIYDLCMKKESPLLAKSFSFALSIVKLHDDLVRDQKEYIISAQLIRSATSVGANIEEGMAAQSRRDFINKLSISSKEARESNYWLRLLLASEKITENEFEKLHTDLLEVQKMLSSSIATAKKNLHSSL